MFHKKNRHIHFLGIGGIGMSGIASILRAQGHTVSGCDLSASSPTLTQLRASGCSIFEGNNTAGCHTNYDILVYSSAISVNNPEIIAAQQRGVHTVHRALMLAELMRTKQSIAITGSHGKTTSSSLLAHILIKANYDPTIIIGGYLSTISSNAYYGSSNFLIAEADESDRSFTQLSPTSALVTNIDLEHLETYRSLEDIKESFKKFFLQISGKIFLCVDNKPLQSIIPSNKNHIVTFGIERDANFNAANIQLNKNSSYFDVQHHLHHYLGTISLPLPGHHNILNALGAVTIAYDLGIPFQTIQHALQSFEGVERRFSYRGIFQGAEVFDDYAHHPQEIYHTLLVAQKKTKNRLIVLFQPHRYSRTQGLWSTFIDVFSQSSIDHLLITDIYAANETPIPAVSSKKLVKALHKKTTSCTAYLPYDPYLKTIREYLSSLIKPDDLLLILGAGNINQIIPHLMLPSP